jgi:hypothetical protein
MNEVYIYSPYYPSHYGRSTKMNTVIDVEEGKFIQLTVLYVSLVETLTEEMLMYVRIVFVQSRCILEK